jgi:penicillin-binding protein-related factor A (putative recombinase)
MSAGTRGKFAEGAVAKWLKKFETAASVATYRPPDRRAGSFAVAPCDRFILIGGKLVALEVKEVDHDFRLPTKNFGLDQRGRMRVWQLAGAQAWVLIHFTPIKQWRLVYLDYFGTQDTGSWDLSHFNLLTLDDAMKTITQVGESK